jgi:hypothetical protein
MNTKITFLLLLILIVILMLFYYADVESNIIILLAVTIVLLVHNLITKREHFSQVDQRAEMLEEKLNILFTLIKALQTRTTDERSNSENTIEGIPFNFSCPFKATSSDSSTTNEISEQSKFANAGIKLNGINSSLLQLTPQQYLDTINNAGSTEDETN